MNDYNIIKIYEGYLQMNIDYYFSLTLVKEKIKMITKIYFRIFLIFYSNLYFEI